MQPLISYVKREINEHHVILMDIDKFTKMAEERRKVIYDEIKQRHLCNLITKCSECQEPFIEEFNVDDQIFMRCAKNHTWLKPPIPLSKDISIQSALIDMMGDFREAYYNPWGCRPFIQPYTGIDRRAIIATFRKYHLGDTIDVLKMYLTSMYKILSPKTPIHLSKSKLYGS